MRILKDDERWFDVPNDPDGATIKIKHLSPEELSDINDDCFKQKTNYKVGKGKKSGYEPELTVESDPKLYREMPILKAVVDWTKFFDKKGKSMDCTPKNIERAIRQIDGFSDLVGECREQLAKDIAQEKGDQLKNLKGSASKPVK